MSLSWLSSLVRARQVQEDTARRKVADAHRNAGTVRARMMHAEEYIEDLRERVDTEMTASAFVAANVALQSAAAVHAAASFAVQQADLTTAARQSELLAAAVARGAAEKLQEHAETVERARVMRAEQAQNDETAARIHFERMEATS
jgi:flagellar biosynthesis chaperone FliJ